MILDKITAANTFYGFTVTDGAAMNLLGVESYPGISWKYFVLLNLPERTAYFLSLKHYFNRDRYSRKFFDGKNIYALAVKTKKVMPYVKITANHFWDNLSLFYYLNINKPRGNEPAQPVPGTPYTLYTSEASPEQLQIFYDFMAEQSRYLKREKLNIEISGNYIIFYKLSGGNNPCYFRDKVYPAALSLAEMLDK
ncbi:MAG: hypothetical protein FWF35_04550 [Elusimicrobia bacterium]|nr:hypothetical protein [Elusimicrobiota bacterium]